MFSSEFFPTAKTLTSTAETNSLGASQLSFSQSLDETVQDWERAKAYTLEYLEAMPDDQYALKPTPEMRSFAQQMLHLTDGNYGLIASALGYQKSL